MWWTPVYLFLSVFCIFRSTLYSLLAFLHLRRPPRLGRPMSTPPAYVLSERQRRMYAREKEENFRWIARWLSSLSSRILTHEDLVASALQLEIADIGQFAEVAHGSVDPDFVWKNLSRLVQPTFPLEGYNALEGSELLGTLHGEAANLQAYIAYRPATRQLIVAFSGTSSLAQTFYDLDFRMLQYPFSDRVGGEAKVHRGFWSLFQGLKQCVLDELGKALESLDVRELVITGHSMGGSQSFLLAMELLQSALRPLDYPGFRLRQGLPIKLVAFGSPRIGNVALTELYRTLVTRYQEDHGKESFKDYLVKGYNDGAHCLPPKVIGFRHLSQSPLYLFHGGLYRIPPSESECSTFPVKPGDDALPPEYPLGGHNYYNDRDMEKTLRRLRWLDLLHLGQTAWEERYLRHLSEESSG
ncbi:alpha/beta-hydrolase [Phellopilus nigrolimitatus]|nr:alpha/beta-hydrolase [Phellopilus nigrolimitatus]